MPASSTLPDPTPEEHVHQELVAHRLRKEIAATGGAISFARFMELTLHAPGLGYYAAGQHKFGPRGDFITAPELGSVFARCLARPCLALLEELGAADILEVGAGSGILAADLLRELNVLGRLPQRYFILELSADLHARQTQILREKIPDLMHRVHWLAELPPDFRGLVLANEVLDAMPVTRFEVTPDGIVELWVGWEQNRFEWKSRPVPEPLYSRLRALQLPPGYRSEINLHAEAWLRTVAERLQQGMVLLIDYGFPRAEFFHPQRQEGTLMCHYRHRAHADPLQRVGLQDITAHVDFSAIAEAGTGAGLTLLGYTSQGAFLLGCGLEQIAAASDPGAARAHFALTQQIKKLTLPHEMGELYKVLALGRGVVESRPEFSIQDRRARL